jgi:hypothetical protein
MGKTPQALPTARVSAIFSGEIPWVICRTTGSTTRRCQKVRGIWGGLSAGREGIRETKRYKQAPDPAQEGSGRVPGDLR